MKYFLLTSMLLLAACMTTQQRLETASTLWCGEVGSPAGTESYASCYGAAQQIITAYPYSNPQTSHDQAVAACSNSNLEPGTQKYNKCYTKILETATIQSNQEGLEQMERSRAVGAALSAANANIQQQNAANRARALDAFKQSQTRCTKLGNTMNCTHY